MVSLGLAKSLETFTLPTSADWSVPESVVPNGNGIWAVAGEISNRKQIRAPSEACRNRNLPKQVALENESLSYITLLVDPQLLLL